MHFDQYLNNCYPFKTIGKEYDTNKLVFQCKTFVLVNSLYASLFVQSCPLFQPGNTASLSCPARLREHTRTRDPYRAKGGNTNYRVIGAQMYP